MLADYRALIRGETVYVAEDGARVVGVLVVIPLQDAVLVENVAVHPSRQGLRVGLRLMRFAEEYAREKGLHELRLYTNESMEENVSFYTSLGFEETDRRFAHGYRRVFMSKKL